jgi:hypothetical protein
VAAGATPGKTTLVASYPAHLAREVSANGRLPPLRPEAKPPVSMLSHLGTSDRDAEFDDKLPIEVLAANALAHGMLGAPMELPHRAEVEAKLKRSMQNVRCYGGAEAHEACSMVGARAFTVGNVIVFAEATPALELVLHEAVHSIQQGGAKRTPAPGVPWRWRRRATQANAKHTRSPATRWPAGASRKRKVTSPRSPTPASSSMASST